MLLDLREKVRSSKPLKYSLITLISIPFVLVGIGSYFSGGTAAPVAEVNGEPIDQVELDSAYQRERQRFAAMFGGQLPAAFDNEAMLREQALQQLVTQRVVASEVAEQKFAVGDETLGRAIRNLPSFQVDGQFDSAAYQTQLQASGMTVPMFEQSFRDDTALTQFSAGVSSTSFTLPQEAERLAALGRQTRTIEAVQFDFEKAKEGEEVSEEELVAFFEENQDNYQFPERVKIQYIELDSNAVAADIEISDEQAQAYYDNNRARYITPEQREAAHILLEAGDESEADQIATLTELKTRIEAGESFADLAQEFSQDIGSAGSGGSLGVIAEGDIGPEFEAALFALSNEGDVSDPVVSDFGVHLIRLDKISPESGQPFDEVKDEIIETMQQDEADREFFDLRDLLAELSFDNPGSLDPAADETGLELKTSDWLDADTDSGPVLSNPGLMQAAFSDEVLEEENNSDIIEIDTRHIVVLRVAEYEDVRPKSLEDVRDEATDALKGEKARESMDGLVDSVLAQLSEGKGAEEAAGESELTTVFVQEILDRQSSVFDRSVMSRIFSLPHPDGDDVISDRTTLANGDELALRLDAVAVPEPAAVEDGDAADEDAPASPVAAGVLEAGANPRLGEVEFQALLESLRNKADVEFVGRASP